MADKQGKKTGGRTKGTLNKKTRHRRIAEAKALGHLKKSILDKWDELFEAQLQLATGVKVQKTIGDKDIVFTKPPDAFAGQYLMSVVVGKPVETRNVNTTVRIPEIVYVKVGSGNGKSKTGISKGNGKGNPKGNKGQGGNRKRNK